MSYLARSSLNPLARRGRRLCGSGVVSVIVGGSDIYEPWSVVSENETKNTPQRTGAHDRVALGY